MSRVIFAAFILFIQSTLAIAAESSVEFYFHTEAVLARPGAAGAQQWTDRCVAGGEFADVAASYAPDPAMDMAERKTQAAKFDQNEAVRIATEAWKKANVALPQGSLRICVDLARVGDRFTRDTMDGISAVTAGRGRIILRIHPDADWKAVLPYVLAHEMHHSYWVQQHFNAQDPFTLADYLVFEGRADYFAASLFKHRMPWTTSLDNNAYAVTWAAMAKDLASTDWDKLQSAMFGSQRAGIPMWAGYSIGYRLVSERMAKTPTLDLKTMTSAPASTFMPK